MAEVTHTEIGTFMTSTKGKTMIADKSNYIYHYQKPLAGNKQRFKCEFHHDTKCKAAVHVMVLLDVFSLLFLGEQLMTSQQTNSTVWT